MANDTKTIALTKSYVPGSTPNTLHILSHSSHTIPL